MNLSNLLQGNALVLTGVLSEAEHNIGGTDFTVCSLSIVLHEY